MAETDKPSLSLRPGGFSSRSGNKDGNATKEGSSKPAQESSTTTETTNASAALSNPESELKDPTKHPLEYPWTMWYPVTKGSSYSTSQIYTFQTVENFWALFNNLEMPSKISDTGKKIDMFFFRSGYKPEWEDPANVGGASLCALFPRPSDRQKVDVGWLNTVLALIGNTFPVRSLKHSSILSLFLYYPNRFILYYLLIILVHSFTHSYHSFLHIGIFLRKY